MVHFKIELDFSLRRKKAETDRQKTSTTGMAFAEAEAAAARAARRFKTAANYLTAARSLSSFFGHAQWRFADLTVPLLTDYQSWLCTRGLCMNTVSAYMRALRTLHRRATDLGLATTDAALFRRVFTGREMTAKRSATADDLRRLRALNLPEGSLLALARDIFIFSFYAMGMPFVDIAYLRKSQVSDGQIHYARRKTAQRISVAVEPCMEEIMRRLDNPASDFVFPILDASDDVTLHRQYLSRLRSYNYSLCRLAEMAHCSRHLSSYVARHSWASLAYKNNVDLKLIGKAMGHTTVSTTLIYIKSLFDPSLADINHKLIDKLGLE